jgi:carboxymethylenebutenolidase
MNISRQSTSRWSDLAAALVGLVLLVTPGGVRTAAQPPTDTPFLEKFRAPREPTVVTREVAIRSAAGEVKGYLARPDTQERLPAVLLLHDETGPSDWLKEQARALSGIGYLVLVPDLTGEAPKGGKSPGPVAILADEPLLSKLSAMVRWLRRRPDVLPGQVGVVGWSWGSDLALALASAVGLQGCVLCHGSLAADPALLGSLRATPLFVLVAGKDPALDGFRKALDTAHILHRVRVFDDVIPGFMMPKAGKPAFHKETEEAWVEIYNFLGRYVEDAPDNGPVFGAASKSTPARESPIATISDLMRSINGPTGVRTTLIQSLEKEPAGQQEWKTIRANAALVAEAGLLLEDLTPPRGTHGHWVEQTHEFTASARKLLAAAGRQDYPGARRGLEELAGRCATCHKQHR